MIKDFVFSEDLINRYKEYAKSKNGTLVKLEKIQLDRKALAYYICEKGHEFSNQSGYSRWCPTCADEIRKQKLVERNKAGRIYSLLPEDINNAVKQYDAEYAQMDYTPQHINEKVKFRLFDGTIKEVAICHALKGHLGKREKNSEKFKEDSTKKIKEVCEKAKFTFVEIKWDHKNSIRNSKIVYLNKQGKLREKQGRWFLNGKFAERTSITRPMKEMEQYLLDLGLSPVLEHYIHVGEEGSKGWEKYFELKQQEKHRSQGKIEEHKRNIRLDIFVPSHNIAIEYHGAKWHDSFKYPSKRYECAYKRDVCNKLGIHLIQIWQHEWSDRREQMKGILRNKFGKTPNKINARDCEVREINKDEAKSFISKYHLQSAPSSMWAAYGMFHGSMLVAAVSLKKEGKEVENGLYLDRLVIHPDYNIRGSLGKFNKFLKSKHSFLYTLIDLRLHNPDNWVKSGWELERIMDSSYSYFDIQHNKHYDKRKFRTIPKDFVNTTEHGNESAYVRSLGTFCKLWNCGRARLILKNS